MTLFLVSASYENDGLTYWFYDDQAQTIVKKPQVVIEFELNLPHHYPYCYTFDSFVVDGQNIVGFAQEKKYYAIAEQWVTLNKPLCSSPTVIYNRKTDSGLRKTLKNTYETDYTYILRVASDFHLIFGLPYERVEYPDLQPPIAVNDTKKFMEFVNFYRKLLDVPAPKFKRCATDIEIASYELEDEEYSEPKNADNPVIAVSVVGSDGFKVVLVLKRFPHEQVGLYQTENGVMIQVFESEREMFTTLFKIWRDYPMILTFWGDKFDLYYIYQRAKKLGFKTSEIPIRLNFSKMMKYMECQFTHAIHIDMAKLLMTRFLMQAMKTEKMARRGLQEYSKLLLKKEKLKILPFTTCTIQELAAYNLRDSELTLELSQIDGDKCLNLAMVISRLTNCPLDMTTRKSTSALLQNHLKWVHVVLNFLMPNENDIALKRQYPVRKSEISEDKYLGAILLQPKPGMHFNIHVLDFASLYASVTDIHNISYETIVCGHDECRENIVPLQSFYSCRKNRGILSLTIGAIRYLRVNIYKKGKTEWDKAVTAVLKLFGNATYGIFGSEKFVPDLYIPPVAASIASYGRSHETFALKLCDTEGYPALYGDTDSVFLQSEHKEPLEKIAEEVRRVRGVDLDLDRDFRFVILWKKKHYIGVEKDGKVIVKGMTGEKYHVCPYIKKVFEKVKDELSKIQTPQDYQEARKSISKLVKTSFSELKLGKWKLEEMVFMVKLDKAAAEKNSQDYMVAKQYNERGLRKTAGDWIYKIFTRGEHSAKPYEFSKPEEVDTDKYAEHLKGALEQVLEPMGIGMQGILSDFAPLTNYTNPLEIVFPGEELDKPPEPERVVEWWREQVLETE